MGVSAYLSLIGRRRGWAFIRDWALINSFCLQDGRLFEVGANSRLGAHSNKYSIHILCLKRKLFSSKKENRPQHHFRLGNREVQFLPKTAASPFFFLLPLVPCASSPVTRVSRSPLLAITTKKSKCLRRGKRVGGGRGCGGRYLARVDLVWANQEHDLSIIFITELQPCRKGKNYCGFSKVCLVDPLFPDWCSGKSVVLDSLILAGQFASTV